MSFQQALSGLNAASKNLDVIGNNVSNANTVGAKVARAEFADQYANALYGAASNAVGIGTQLAAVAQQFTQGDVATTSNPLDLAINGQGFFPLRRSGALEYSRNGQFKLDSQGFIVNNQGSRLQGYEVDTDGKAQGDLVDMKLSTGFIAPNSTDQATVELNLDARIDPIPAATKFDPGVAASYSGSTSMTVYDALGESHTLALYFRPVDPDAGDTGTAWEVYATVDNAPTPALAAAGADRVAVGKLEFGSDGTLGSVTSTAAMPAGSTELKIALNPAGADDASRQFIPLEIGNATQFGYDFGVTKLYQDGYASGRLNDFTIDSDGTIVARYSNGQTDKQGRIALANFTNPQGLAPIGGNAWRETSASGPATPGTPGTGNLGALTSGAVESSNIDLTAELVNMITAQRIYQANAQTIRTQDQVMQTIVNLR